jgi:DNA-binding transcriptional regulator YhcF (GntR family)
VIIAVDTDSGVPPYEQIRAQVSRMIASGVLPAGTRLPTIQQLANDLHLAPGTVARGYKELEREGLVVSKRRKGTIVAEHPDRAPAREIRQELDSAIERFMLQVRQLGAEPAEALDRARALLDSGRIAS